MSMQNTPEFIMSPRKTNKPAGDALKPINYHCLYVLQNASPKLRRAIIQNADPSLINAISECCKNVLNNPAEITERALKHLKPLKNDIRKLSDKHKSVGSRRKLIVQKGGFLQYLLPFAISTLADIISRKNE